MLSLVIKVTNIFIISRCVVRHMYVCVCDIFFFSTDLSVNIFEYTSTVETIYIHKLDVLGDF